MPLLSAVLVLALATGGLAGIVRALPWPKSWRARKPLACSVCMGFWSALVLCVIADFSYQLGWIELFWLLLSSTGAGAFIVQHASPPPIDLELPVDANALAEVPTEGKRK